MGNHVIKKGVHVLVVEDSPTQAEHLRNMLEGHDMSVLVAGNATEALSMLIVQKPDIILSDIIMPGIDGFALCRNIKDNERIKDIPIIILTSLSDPLDVIKGLESGADSFVTKPYEEKYLLERIEHLLTDRNKPRCVSEPKYMDISINGRDYKFSSDRRQILNLFLSSYEAAYSKNHELSEAQDELRKINAKLVESNRELKAANEELELFGYTVSHDLRQPLNVISSYSQAVMELCGKHLDAECKNYVQQITDRTFSMSELINSLLKLSKIKHVSAKRETIDLSTMANVIAGEFRISEPHRKVTFNIEEGVTTHADRKLLWLVLENLLGNAWKYTSRKDEALIEFGTMTVKNKTAFFVRDNGVGFEMLDSDKLFTPFQRLTKDYEGHGIGLATVHRIIKHHNGKIWAEGEPGKGATFFFAL